MAGAAVGTRARRLRRWAQHGLLAGFGAAALVLALRPLRLMQAAEMRTYDARTRLLADPGRAHPDVVIAAIDDRSLAEMEPTVGKWPWPRNACAGLIDYLTFAGARAIVFDVQYAEADARAAADSDFAAAIAESGRVVLPITLSPGVDEEDPAKVAAVNLSRFSLPSSARGLPDAPRTSLPLPMFAAGAAGVGTILLNADSTSGALLRERLVTAHGGRLYPSLSLAAARVAYPDRFGGRVEPRGGEMRMGRASVPLDRGEMVLRWRGPFITEDGRQTYPVYSFSRLFKSFEAVAAGQTPTVPPDSLRGKVVFVAATASGLLDLRSTPFGDGEPGVMVHATALDNLLRGDPLRRAPEWANAGTVLVTALAAAALVAVVPSAAGATAAALLVVLLAAAGACAAFAGGVWLDAAAPVLAGALAYTGSMTAGYVTEGRERRRVRDLFSRYVVPEVVRQLTDEEHDLKLGGQRVPLTILFSDIRGFTSLSEKLPAETVVEMLNEYLDAMSEVVFRHGGTLDKYIGDAVMAFWGAPLPVPDGPRRAAETALEMMAELEALNARWAHGGRSGDLRIGIGINTGDAVVGNIGSLKRKLDYTAIGDAVNLASRLESLNKDMGTSIIISHSTFELLGDAYEARPLPEVHVKGKEEPVQVLELKGRRAASPPPRTQADAAKAVATAAVVLLLACAPGTLAAQKLRWSDQVYTPGRWQAGQVAAWSTTNPSTDTLALVARVEGYAKPPRWRAEIRRVAQGGALSEPLVLLGERNQVFVLTGVSSTPLARHAMAADPLVTSVVARFDAAGALKQPGAGRLVERGADRKVAQVVVRRPALVADFDDGMLTTSRSRRTLGGLVQTATRGAGSNRSQAVVATAGARGVWKVQTPTGTVDVTPDSAAVTAMLMRPVDEVALDGFVRGGSLGGQALPIKEEEGTP